ncbi:Cytochrome P450, partial [Amanita muscaria]
RHPNIQQKLREELHKYPDCDPNWNQLKNELRYLDAVVHETIRLHPALETLMRMATQDDTLPLSNPIQTASGEIVDSVMIPKGTAVILPHVLFNTSEEFCVGDSSAGVLSK